MIKKKRLKKVYWLSLFFMIGFFTFSFNFALDEMLRRVQVPSDISFQIGDALQSLLAQPEKARPALQYGQTLGEPKLRKKLAEILANFGIGFDPLKNLGIFHDLSEISAILGEIFLNPQDLLLVQSEVPAQLVQPLAYYQAELRSFSSQELVEVVQKQELENLKLVFISDTSKFSPSERNNILNAAREKNFIIVEHISNLEEYENSLKKMDQDGRVVLVGNFDTFLPGISSFIPLAYLEASSELMEKIEIAKGSLTLHTNSLLQYVLLELLEGKNFGFQTEANIEFQEEKTSFGEDELSELLGERGARLRPSEIREILKYSAIEGLIYLAGGIPDPALFPLQEVREIVQNIGPQEWEEMKNFSSIKGLPRLREAIASWLERTISVPLSSEDILVTNGSQQALEILGRWVAEENRVVITESPTYLGVLTAMVPHIGEERIVHMDLRSKEGLERLREFIQSLRNQGESAPLIYLTPTFGNPAGDLWSDQERQALLDLVDEFRREGYEIVVAEDDPYGELNYTGLEPGEKKVEFSRMKALNNEAVIYMTSNSKVFSPGLRTGYIVATPEYREKFEKIMDELSFKVPALPQFIIAEFIQQGYIDQHLDKIRRAYKVKAEAMQKALEKYSKDALEEIEWTEPLGGLFVWPEIPAEWGIDLTYLVHNVATQQGVEIDGRVVQFAYVPGEPFSLDGSTRNNLRLTFATPTLEEIDLGVHALIELIKQYRNLP